MEPIKSAPICGKHKMADLLIEDEDLYKWSEGELFFINLVKKNTYFNDESKPVIRFHKIAKIMDTAIKVCSDYWSAMKDRYFKYKTETNSQNQLVKYLDGTLSFIDNNSLKASIIECVNLSDDDSADSKLNSSSVIENQDGPPDPKLNPASVVQTQNATCSSTFITEDTIAALLQNTHDDETDPSNNVVDLVSQVISISLQKQIQASIIAENNLSRFESDVNSKQPDKEMPKENTSVNSESQTNVSKTVKKQRNETALPVVNKKPNKHEPEKNSFLQKQLLGSGNYKLCSCMQPESQSPDVSICLQNKLQTSSVADKIITSNASHSQFEQPDKDESRNIISLEDISQRLIVSNENSVSNKTDCDLFEIDDQISIICDAQSTKTSTVTYFDSNESDKIKNKKFTSSRKRPRSPKQLNIAIKPPSFNPADLTQALDDFASDISQSAPTNKKQKKSNKEKTTFPSLTEYKDKPSARLLNLVQIFRNSVKGNDNVKKFDLDKTNQLLNQISNKNQNSLPNTIFSEKKQVVDKYDVFNSEHKNNLNRSFTLEQTDHGACFEHKDNSGKKIELESKYDALNSEYKNNPYKNTLDSGKVKKYDNNDVSNSEEVELVSFFSPENSEKGDDENLDEVICLDDEEPGLEVGNHEDSEETENRNIKNDKILKYENKDSDKLKPINNENLEEDIFFEDEKPVLDRNHVTGNKIIEKDIASECEDEYVDKLTPLNNNKTVREFFIEVGEFVARRFTIEQQEIIRKDVWSLIAEMDKKICDFKKHD